MKFLYLVLSVWMLSCCTPKNQSFVHIDFRERWDTIRVLENPNKGWYHHLLDNGIDKYAIRDEKVFGSFPGMDHLYLRLAWSYLEPEEGVYDWHRIDEVVSKYVPLGYKISFRISSKETGTKPGSVAQEINGVQYATPVWVKEAGAKGVVAENGGVYSWVPKWDDPVYIEKLNNFHRAFAARYDGKPWLSYVDIGSIGDWGEGHTNFSTKVPPTVNEVKANLDLFLKNYKKSQLVCTDDLMYYGKPDFAIESLYDYATSKGITLRDDSPLVDWYLDHNLETWSISHPQFYDPLFLTKPIIFELQHYGVVKKNGNWLGKNGTEVIPKYGYSGAEIMHKAIETIHATYIGYHGYAEEWLADNPELTAELANRCGYWYFPVSVTLPGEMKTGQNLVQMEWLNKGVAPAYQSYGICFKFESLNSSESFELTVANSGNKNWLPKILKPETYRLQIPQNVKEGRYQLKFKLLDLNTQPAAPIQIGIHADLIDKDQFITAAIVNIQIDH